MVKAVQEAGKINSYLEVLIPEAFGSIGIRYIANIKQSHYKVVYLHVFESFHDIGIF